MPQLVCDTCSDRVARWIGRIAGELYENYAMGEARVVRVGDVDPSLGDRGRRGAFRAISGAKWHSVGDSMILRISFPGFNL